jgi:hypothetical protein
MSCSQNSLAHLQTIPAESAKRVSAWGATGASKAVAPKSQDGAMAQKARAKQQALRIGRQFGPRALYFQENKSHDVEI